MQRIKGFKEIDRPKDKGIRYQNNARTINQFNTTKKISHFDSKVLLAEKNVPLSTEVSLRTTTERNPSIFYAVADNAVGNINLELFEKSKMRNFCTVYPILIHAVNLIFFYSVLLS